ncbi:hypothetical protein [Hymenobacter metallicola]|uniref:Uncharacterized protein n=1 Tax=Hymenobacter metallicola TaxID=2563114 RepID=A0A4Z0QEE1_9BACT|nr:hypothetical protein [Hymenobacter metallicola]TGE27563.1 hypothetical protein E5K02_14420 [Hymenobacter metallicola]
MQHPFRFLLLLLTSIALAAPAARAQQVANADADFLEWSATRRITAADFQLKLQPHSNLRGSNASLHCSLNGPVFELLGKGGNKIFHNQMLRSASWLDTTNRADIPQQIRFQQTLFDIQEIYLRRLRQQARASARKMVLLGKPDINELLAGQMKECQLRQVRYTEETNYATLPDKQAAWEQQIRAELQELQAFEATN